MAAKELEDMIANFSSLLGYPWIFLYTAKLLDLA
jgi:hypothetical protein